MLLLGDSCNAGRGGVVDDTRLVAIDPATRSVLWATPRGAFKRVIGVTVLPAHGVAVASSYEEDALHVHALADGARLASTPTLTPKPTSLAADPRSGIVFASTECSRVYAYRWTGARTAEGADASGKLAFLGALTLPPSMDVGSGETLHLAFMPPFPGSGAGAPGYLVIGVPECTSVAVCPIPAPQAAGALTSGLSQMPGTGFPGDATATSWELPDGIVNGEDYRDNLGGLSGDPLGTVLFVASASGLHATEWPFPGMIFSECGHPQAETA